MASIILKSGPFKVIMFAAAALLFVSCAPQIFAFMNSTRITERRSNGIIVTLNLAKTNVMKNQLSIINNGNDLVTVSSQDIILRAHDSLFFLNAVADFGKYVTMRQAEANKTCLESTVPATCSDSIDKYFKGVLNSQVFTFAPIMPGEKRRGMIAFNLPDPFNDSPEAKRISEILKSKSNVMDGEIIIYVHKGSEKIDFSFPIIIDILPGDVYLPLRILRFY